MAAFRVIEWNQANLILKDRVCAPEVAAIGSS